MGFVRYARECMGVVCGLVRRLSKWKRDRFYGSYVGLRPRGSWRELVRRGWELPFGLPGRECAGQPLQRPRLPFRPQFISLKAKRPEAGTGGERARATYRDPARDEQGAQDVARSEEVREGWGSDLLNKAPCSGRFFWRRCCFKRKALADKCTAYQQRFVTDTFHGGPHLIASQILSLVSLNDPAGLNHF